MEEKKENTMEKIEEGMKELDKITKGKAVLDFFQSKLISRKFMVFVTATVFLCLKMISAENWILISGCYIGTNALVEFGNVLKSKSPEEDNK